MNNLAERAERGTPWLPKIELADPFDQLCWVVHLAACQWWTEYTLSRMENQNEG